ncbi:hypothetical protein D3C84_404430 [compost metagenome]
MLELVGHDRKELVLEVTGIARLGQLQALLFMLALVAGQVPGDFHVALKFVTVEQGDFAAAEESAAVLAQVPAFIFEAPMIAGRLQFVLRNAVGTIFG